MIDATWGFLVGRAYLISAAFLMVVTKIFAHSQFSVTRAIVFCAFGYVVVAFILNAVAKRLLIKRFGNLDRWGKPFEAVKRRIAANEGLTWEEYERETGEAHEKRMIEFKKKHQYKTPDERFEDVLVALKEHVKASKSENGNGQI